MIISNLNLILISLSSLITTNNGNNIIKRSLILESLLPFSNSTTSLTSSSTTTLSSSSLAQSNLFLPPSQCPPCNPFNCVLPAFNCLNTGQCNDYNGQCICPPGFGGEDCSKPLCDSLADGNNRFPREGDSCQCDEGWTGLNCNVCETNKACDALVVRDPSARLLRGGASDLIGAEDEDDGQAVCYKEGYGIKEMFQMCDVTNQKILDMLPDRPPQVTFTCNIPSATCGFQFWIGQVESFYCGLSNCSAHLETGYESNYTEYNCGKMECSCIPGKMLCGEDGSVDISEFLTEEIKGPAKFSTRTGEGSKFEEPAMNQLITDIFGDAYITLNCQSGECMHISSVPGFQRPPKPSEKKMVLISIGLVVSTLLVGLFLFWYYGRSSANSVEYSFLRGRIRLPSGSSSPTSNSDDPQSHMNGKSLLEDHIPTALQFSNLSYTLPNGKLVLDNITGSVQPGEILAIIGASGAGKSTFLDLLARKYKSGIVSGEILVNGKIVSASEYRRVVGFVDQEDTLMGTLTVYETVLYSALLRLPRTMSFGEKKMRTLETMFELGILGIRDSRIGESGKRGISGGEKRRVSIACELVTSPSILFLDEPTSGLDSYNAFNVIESLVQLSRNYKRTVIFTIHQPRSNIVALFDKLILLSSGKLVYQGKTEECQQYFEANGSICPSGYNIADYLIDLTMQKEESDSSTTTLPLEEALIQLGSNDAELGRSRLSSSNGNDTELDTRPNSSVSPPTTFNRLFKSSSTGTSTPQSSSSTSVLSTRLLKLVQDYKSSSIASSTRDEINEAKRLAEESGHSDGDTVVLRSYERASWSEQFRILSGRSFKNLYRDPMLMVSHYLVSVVVACICAFLFQNLTLDIPGFQNRMGIFFFILAIFGFGSLSTLNAFSAERLLFIRERANGYYSPITYFSAKLLFDIIPLRVLPPFLLGAIIYNPVGLVPTAESFWKFILVLVLFNLTASSSVLLLGVTIENVGIANLAGSLVMLFNLLFAGLLINRDALPWYLQWLETFSFFHAAFEALLVNEVRLLSLKDHRYGVDIEVPAATILSMFGFRAQAFWFPDIALLVGLFLLFTASAFIALVFLVRERR